MDSSLITLPPETVRWLAAGEIVDSLAAALRELVDNALDAQGTRIIAEVWPQQGRVRVSDNGHGIPPADLPAVALPATTTKLSGTILPPVVTALGFRGQALNALAQAGSLSIASRIPQADHGWQSVYDPWGQSLGVRPVGMSVGSVVEVNQLWQEWPQRRTQIVSRGSLEQVIYAAALVHPQVHWLLHINDRLRLHLTAGSVIDQLCQRWPRLHPQDCRQAQEGSWQVILALPSHFHRPRPDACWVGINGRLVTVPELQITLLEGFRHSLPPRRYPLCLALGSLPPEDVDWNRHPAKTELFIQNLEHHQSLLATVIERILAPPPSHVPAAFVRRLREQARSYPASGGGSVQVLTQLDSTYIVIRDADGLALVEQHVAHERVQFERLQAQCEWVEVSLLLPKLGPAEVERLAALGADPEPFGHQQWRLRQIPRLLLGLPEPEQIQILRSMAACGDVQSALVPLACRTAIRNGQQLSLPEMQTLVQDWQQTRFPHTCPHGRPIALRLRESDLQRFFGRRYNVCHPGLGDRLANEVRADALETPGTATQFYPPS